ncbi:MAG: hypothetical protein ACRCYZ_05430 [Alphaproteobacteria bacterium]
MTTIKPVAVVNRLTFIDQAENVKALSIANGKHVVNQHGNKVLRTKLNAYSDQPETDVFSGTLGFMVMPIDEWLALKPYDANRPWQSRFEDKAHLRGMLESPLQTLGYALVDSKGNPICRLDGNGRAGAWLAGALEKPEFVHVITIVLPDNVKETDYFVSNLFDTLNGDAQKVSPEHKAIIAKLRLTISGEWVEFDSGLVETINKTAFTGLGSYLNKPDGQAKNLTATDWIFANKEVVFLVDSLGIQKRDINEENRNCYTASVIHCMLRTLAGFGDEKGAQACPIVQKKAYLFWQQWKENSENELISSLYNETMVADQSGAKGTAAVKENILKAFKTWRDLIGKEELATVELPSYDKWLSAKQEAAAQALKDAERAEKEAEQAARVASVMDNPIDPTDREKMVSDIKNQLDTDTPKEGIFALLLSKGYNEKQAEELYKEAGGKDETAVVVAPESETLEGLAPVVMAAPTLAELKEAAEKPDATEEEQEAYLAALEAQEAQA